VTPWTWPHRARGGATPVHAAERTLLERVDEALARVARLPEPTAGAVRGVLTTLTDGMLFDLARFPGDGAAGLAANARGARPLYYLVAGCVGEFWTDLPPRASPPLHGWDPRRCAHRRRVAKAASR